MLDFYLINDGQPKAKSPQKMGLELAGSIDDDAFEELQSLGIIESRFDYYSTFRWDTCIIKQIQEKLERIDKNNSSLEQLKKLLEKASKMQSGVIAYGD